MQREVTTYENKTEALQTELDDSQRRASLAEVELDEETRQLEQLKEQSEQTVEECEEAVSRALRAEIAKESLEDRLTQKQQAHAQQPFSEATTLETQLEGLKAILEEDRCALKAAE